MSQPTSSPPEPDDEELPEFEDRAKPFLWKMAMGFCLLMAVLLAIKPTFHRFKRQRGIAAADQVENLMLARKYDEAAEQMKVALELAPQVPKVIRVAAQLLTRQNDPRAIAFWQGLLSTSEGSRDDRLKYLEFALAQGRTDLTGPELESMLRLNSHDMEARQLMLRHLALRDDLKAAVSMARGWLSDAPADVRTQLMLGQLLQRHPDEALRDEGRRLLLSVANSQSSSQETAVNLLSDDPKLSPTEIQQLLRSIEARPGNQLRDRIRIADLRLRLEPERSAEIVDSLVKAARGASDEELAILAIWLRSRATSDAVARALPLERVRSKNALLTLRLEALIDVGKLAEVEPVLSDSSAALNEFQRNLIRARLAARQSPPAPAGQFLQAALDASGDAEPALASVAQYALALKETNALIEAHARLQQFPERTRASSSEMLRLLENIPGTREAQAASRAVSARVPSVRFVEAEACYYDLLLKERVDEAHKRLAEFVAADPNSTRFRYVLALAEWLRGKPDAALALLENPKIEWSKAGWRWQALHAGVLGANDQAEAARAAARAIDISALRPEELAWIKPWL